MLTSEPFSFPTGSDLSMKEIIFSTPASVVAGQLYTLELTATLDQPCSIDSRGNIRTVNGRWSLENTFNCGGSYAGGMHILRTV